MKCSGPLARTKFYPVIADEAQFIRNRSTRSSISMAYVRAKLACTSFRRISHILGRVPIKDAPLAGQHAQEILKPLLLRPTKNSTLEGKPILELPVKENVFVKLQFSPEERNVSSTLNHPSHLHSNMDYQTYRSFESRAKIKLGKLVRERTLVEQ